MYRRSLDVELKHAALGTQRGQAIAETVIFLPLFLFALFGMLWAVKIAVQHERVESAIRYAWAISGHDNPYGNFSFYSMYSELGAPSVPTVACTAPLTDPLADASPTYTSSQATTASPPFFSPTSASAPRCLFTGYLFYYGSHGSDGSAQDVILNVQEPSISSNVAVPSMLAGAIGSSSSSQSSGFVYQQIGLNLILACYPTFETTLNASLDIASDTSTTSTPTSIVYATMAAQTEYQLDYFTPNKKPCGYTAPP